jgi:hypothetical protein
VRSLEPILQAPGKFGTHYFRLFRSENAAIGIQIRSARRCDFEPTSNGDSGEGFNFQEVFGPDSSVGRVIALP